MKLIQKLAKHSSLLLPVATLLILPMIHQPETTRKKEDKPNKLAQYVAAISAIQTAVDSKDVPDIQFSALGLKLNAMELAKKMADSLTFGSDSIDQQKLLFSLFPSISVYQWLKDEIDTDEKWAAEEKKRVVWRCSSCELTSFIEPNERTAPSLANPTMDEKNLSEIQVAFPFERNFTEITDVKYYKTALGEERCVVSFNTGRDEILAGRFLSGMLGIAVLEKRAISSYAQISAGGNAIKSSNNIALKNNNVAEKAWKVVAFNPQVCLQGSFSQSQHVTQVKSFPEGDFFEIESALGVAMGMDFTQITRDYYLVSAADLKVMMFLPGIYQASWSEVGPNNADEKSKDGNDKTEKSINDNAFSQWDGKIIWQVKNKQLMGKLVVEGDYVKDSFHAEASDLPFIAMPLLTDVTLAALGLNTETEKSVGNEAPKSSAELPAEVQVSTFNKVHYSISGNVNIPLGQNWDYRFSQVHLKILSVGK